LPLNSNQGRRVLSQHQARMLREYEWILDSAGLNPERILEVAEDDPTSVTPFLRSMTDQIVRSEVIFEYTMIDMELEHLILRHFFGSGERLRKARSTVRHRTLRQILLNLYLLQKLSILRNFRKVPKSIVSKIAAINDLRNGLAHNFFLNDLPVAKRTYKGIGIFKWKGIEAFREDAWEVRCFFSPWLKKLYPAHREEASQQRV
jgi:hypothetical protein